MDNNYICFLNINPYKKFVIFKIKVITKEQRCFLKLKVPHITYVQSTQNKCVF